MQELLESIFSYHPKNPLIFSNGIFWGWLALILVAMQFIKERITLRNMFLLVFSLFFYYKSSGIYFLLLLLSTVIDYSLGKRIHESNNPKERKRYLVLSLISNLGLLAYFKYSYFLIGHINEIFGTDIHAVDFFAVMGNAIFNGDFDIDKIFLPVGISFFTFQTISYSIDIYRKEIKPVKNIWDFAFFVSFFPQLVAGPIVRASDFIDQIYQPYKLTEKDFGRALFLILGGLVKKVLISDYLSVNLVDRVFDSPTSYTGFENLMGVYGYALQIYCDFSGYSDIAIGIALLLGFNLPLNFNSPYQAVNITDFWRRWHISLSSWLRDYLYIPLGGNRKGKVRTYINQLLTMLLGGLWHGAHIKFIIWGGMHGLALSIHKFWLSIQPKDMYDIKEKSSPWSKSLYRFSTMLLTFHFVCLAWMYFRAKDVQTVVQMIEQIFANFNLTLLPEIVEGYWKVFALMLFGYFIHFIPKQFKIRLEGSFSSWPDYAKAVAITVLIVVLYQAKTADSQPFIYFQF